MSTPTKTCLITGCSSGGVGAALALTFKDKGYRVYATARSPSKVPEELHEASNVTVLPLDVASSQSIAEVAEVVRNETGGKLDVLVNNAGLGLNGPGLDTPISDAKRLFDVNFFGSLEMIQAFSPMLVMAKGCIVNNASVGGHLPLPFLSIYQATKAALIHAGEVWRLELAPLNVRVLTLITGGVQTNFLKHQPTCDLNEESYYAGIKEIIEEQPDKIRFGVSPESFAQDVIHQVEKGTTGKYWTGGGVSLLRPALWLCPQRVMDYLSESQKPFAKRLAEEHPSTMSSQGASLNNPQ